MTALETYRAMTPTQRAAWRSFYDRNIACNPTDPDLAMMGFGHKPFRDFVVAAFVDAELLADQPATPGLTWIPADSGNLPSPTVSIRGWGPMPAACAADTLNAQGLGPIRDRFKPPRSYDTGISRKRRNIATRRG